MNRASSARHARDRHTVRLMPTALPPILLRANRFAIISRLADDLAHEFKNPLNSMVISLELIRRLAERGATDKVIERTRVLDEEALRVNALLDRLLRLLRPPRNSESTTNLAVLLGNVMPLIEMRAKLARIEFASSSEGDAMVHGRSEDLALVLLNIADNAFNAMNHGGSINIATTVGADTVYIRVESTGTGFSAHALSEFEAGNVPVLQHADEWAVAERDGLGLRVCAALLDQSGGGVEIVDPGHNGGPTVVTLALARATSFHLNSD